MTQNLKVLYQDKYITITDCYILIKKYYIPLMTSKTVLFNEMRTISIEDARNVNASWGIDTNHLNNWFQYDSERKNKSKFISIQIKNSAIRPAITPEDVDKAFNVLRNHFAEIDRKSVMFHSNRDKETELQQKQAHEMMKQQLEHQEATKKHEQEERRKHQERCKQKQRCKQEQRRKQEQMRALEERRKQEERIKQEEKHESSELELKVKQAQQ